MQSIGKQAEDNACHFLQTKGLQLLEQNFRCSGGEIDLIMVDGQDIVFVEVRHRSQQNYGSALESVNKTKQKKLIRTALYFLMRHQKQLNNPACRFDVIGIHPFDGKINIEWVKNAFSVENT